MNTEDHHSQIRYIMLHFDHSFRYIINFSINKIRIIVRSVLRGDVYLFSDSFDSVYTLKCDLQSLFATDIPLHMFTESQMLFKVITNLSKTEEKRLMVNIKSIRNVCKVA